MTKKISVAIDIGTTNTRVIIGEFEKGETIPRVIGVGEAINLGMRHGYIISQKEAIISLKKAINEAEKSANFKIKRAFLAVSGISLKSEFSSGYIVVSKADSEVTNLDIEKVLEEAEKNLNLNNKKILNISPVLYKLDGKEVIGRLEGNIGNKLEVRALFTTYSNQHLEDLIGIVAGAGIEVIDVVPSPLANSNISLSKKQKIVGTMLADIGAETTNIAVFENENLTYLHTFAIGGNDITNDIALGLKITLEEAENIKLGNLPENISKKKVDEIIEARLGDIFELIENHLKKIKRNELLPGGIIWTGGGANTENLITLSKTNLKLPSQIGKTEIFGNLKTKLKDTVWFTSLGLLLSGHEKVYEEGSINSFFNDLKNIIKSNIKQFLP